MKCQWPRRLRFGFGLLSVFLVSALVMPWLLPDPQEILDPREAGLLPPFSRVFVVSMQDGTTLAASQMATRDGELQIFRAGAWQTLEPSRVARVGSRFFFLGTDSLGRDVAARLATAGRTSLAVGFLALGLALVLGVGLGLMAGLGPPWLEQALMAFVDAALALPVLFVLLAAGAFLRPSLLSVVLFLGATFWMGVARLTRGQVLQIREQPWFAAAKGLGLQPLRLGLVHVLPNLATPVAQDATLRLGDLILVEASLSFLGFGVPPPIPSWGNMAAEGFEVWRLAWWLPIFPGLAVAATVLAFALIADGIGELARGQRA
ncbi:MAG: ABC transporter permease [Thermoanaerobaculaceae bacterium]